MNRMTQELEYWNKAAQDTQVDIKYISDVDTEECLTKAIRPYLKYGVTLDLGCGVGRLAIPIAEDTDSHVFGVDISREMVNLATMRSAHISNLSLMVGDGRTLQFKNAFFDCAYTMLLFQHLPTEAVQGYIGEVGRVLKPGGIFRFQFIAGNEDEPFSKHHPMSLIHSTLADQGFGIVNQQEGLLHPQWSWITARTW